jgi:major curlin subunit
LLLRFPRGSPSFQTEPQSILRDSTRIGFIPAAGKGIPLWTDAEFFPERHVNAGFSVGSEAAFYNWGIETRSGAASKRRNDMPRKTLIATTFAALIGIVSVPASANDVFLDQFGFGNQAGGAQTGFGNQIGIMQNGIFNGAVSEQYGNGNTAAVGQDGFNNYGETWQQGNGNAAGVGQFGTNHNAIMSQDGNGNIAAGVQVGDGCSAGVSQTGGGNVAAFVQTCP